MSHFNSMRYISLHSSHLILSKARDKKFCSALDSCPDEAPVRRRMLYASSVRALKASLGLESLMQVQAAELSDIDEKVIKHELMSHQRL